MISRRYNFCTEGAENTKGSSGIATPYTPKSSTTGSSENLTRQRVVVVDENEVDGDSVE